MFCPECGCEYREGFTGCNDCSTSLVECKPKLPKPEYVELVTVLTTEDPSLVASIKSLLESENITYYVKNENFSSLYNRFVPFAQMELQVPKENVKEARELLRDIKII